MGKKLMSMMVVVFLLALILSTNPVKATDCLSVLANIFPCANYLRNPVSITPGNQCCDAASKEDIDSLCKCLRQIPLGSGFLPSKAQQLPNLCILAGFLPLVKCLAPSEPSAIIPPLISLPPLAPGIIPPMIPLPPLTPGIIPPMIPFPPLTPLLPPLIPSPPVA